MRPYARNVWPGVLAVMLAFTTCVALAYAEDGFDSLFAQDRLDGWVEEQHEFFRREHPGARTWSVKDGIVRADGARGNCGFLRHEKPLGDFMLRLDYRMSRGCNSGVGFRSSAPYTTLKPNTLPSHLGYELQIMDDHGQPVTKQSTGSIYNQLAAAVNAARPANEWNTLELECRGPNVRATINGVLVQDFSQRDVPELVNRPQRGFLSLQNHGHDIEFRNVRVKTLD